ncbi:hypothetical protein NKI96_24440 [Mesorhizobium sp. M0292]|uniref:hypothetical protein n=1 Tax=Mesorhizobium sp. M0292 TaxID=2956929 RepID=UPI00333557A1
MGQNDHNRLTDQLKKMLAYTTEAFVLIYSKDAGIQVVPAVAALALGSRDLFDVAAISWPWCLSAVFRGRMGEVAGSRVPGSDWEPMFELDILAAAVREKPAPAALAAGG